MDKFKTLITPDGFQWKDVTEAAEDLFPHVFLYEVDEDWTEHPIEDVKDIQKIIDYGGRICVEWGFVESER